MVICSFVKRQLWQFSPKIYAVLFINITAKYSIICWKMHWRIMFARFTIKNLLKIFLKIVIHKRSNLISIRCLNYSIFNIIRYSWNNAKYLFLPMYVCLYVCIRICMQIKLLRKKLRVKNEFDFIVRLSRPLNTAFLFAILCF